MHHCARVEDALDDRVGDVCDSALFGQRALLGEAAGNGLLFLHHEWHSLQRTCVSAAVARLGRSSCSVRVLEELLGDRANVRLRSGGARDDRIEQLNGRELA
nr:hypothetical protein [Leucobacter chromiireducens]